MESLPFTLLAFIVALAILISIHEFGHFWVARKLGIKVLRFSIGFGKPLWKKTGKTDNTEFVVAAVPLGGYVKMLDEREGPVAEHELHRAFNRQNLKVRSAVVIAGPLFNFLFAIFAYWIVFFIGDTGIRPIVGEIHPDSPAANAGMTIGDEILAVGDRKTATWENAVYAFLASTLETDSVEISLSDKDDFQRKVMMNLEGIDPENTEIKILTQVGIEPFAPVLPPVIGEVLSGEAADSSGLQPGDEIIEAAGISIADWNQWVEIIRANPEKTLDVKYLRAGAINQTSLTPKAISQQGQQIGRIGASAEIPQGFFEKYQATASFGPLISLKMAVEKTWDVSALTLNVLGKILIGDASLNNLSGPITIAQAAGKTASIGLIYFLKFLAIVSVSLGVLNLLPIPILDGGHLFFYILEGIKGSPLSESFIEQAQSIGLAILIALMGIAFYVDINRLFN